MIGHDDHGHKRRQDAARRARQALHTKLLLAVILALGVAICVVLARRAMMA